MKPARMFSIVVAIILSFTLMDGVRAGGGNSIHLPIVTANALSPSSFDLIDKAVTTGQLTAEQGLIDKVYALFSDAQLPAQYIGSAATQVDGDLLKESSDFGFLEIPLTEDRAAIKVPTAGGALTGSYKRKETGGDYELMEWNLTPQTK